MVTSFIFVEMCDKKWYNVGKDRIKSSVSALEEGF